MFGRHPRVVNRLLVAASVQRCCHHPFHGRYGSHHLTLWSIPHVNWLIGRDFNLSSRHSHFPEIEKWIFTPFAMHSNADLYCVASQFLTSCVRARKWENTLSHCSTAHHDATSLSSNMHSSEIKTLGIVVTRVMGAGTTEPPWTDQCQTNHCESVKFLIIFWRSDISTLELLHANRNSSAFENKPKYQDYMPSNSNVIRWWHDSVLVPRSVHCIFDICYISHAPNECRGKYNGNTVISFKSIGVWVTFHWPPPNLTSSLAIFCCFQI